MSNSTELTQLQSEVKRLEEMIRAESQANQRVSRIPLAVSAVLVLLLSCFLLINYFKVRSELTPERLGKSLREELLEVSPKALREFNILGKDLLPVYVEEWQKQIQAAWPEISKKLDDEIGKIGDNVTRNVDTLLSESEERVLRKTEKVMLDNFPQLKDPEQSKEVERRLHELCDTSLTKAILHFDRLFSRDVASLEEALLKFNVADTHETKVDLEKKFLHLWLQLLDQEIMEL